LLILAREFINRTQLLVIYIMQEALASDKDGREGGEGGAFIA